MAARQRTVALAAALGVVVAVLPATAALAAPGPVVLHSGLVIQQDLPSPPGVERDTAVEPDVAADPHHPDVAIAAAQDGRFVDGAAAGINASWTADGGASWHHRAVPGITKALGGSYDRATDPSVAFGPDGTAYLSVLATNRVDCPDVTAAVLVLTSRDGGRTWSPPHTAYRTPASCNQFADKTWLVVDTSPQSPHLGRVYQFWTMFRADDQGNYLGGPQAVRWSDDHARTWSATSFAVPPDHDTTGSQPMITATGALIDAYYDFGVVAPPAGSAAAGGAGLAPRIIDNTGDLYASRSDDGGRTWRQLAQVAAHGDANGLPDLRCCSMAATIDRSTGLLYVAFHGAGLGNTDPVFLAVSPDGGRLWTNPVQVSQGDRAGVQRVNVDVVARAGSVYVTYGTRTQPADAGGVVQQQLSVSRNRGTTFGPPQSIGPLSVLKFAARAGTAFFPGDYGAEALAGDRLYVVFPRSSTPPSSSPYHQVMWGVTLQP
jgi:hypothetical protein